MHLAVDQRGEGPPLVLLHGFPLDRGLWDALRDDLSGRHRVVTPDLRGHGASPAPPGVYDMEALASDVLETLDSIGLHGPIVLGGHSMGGYVALALAESRPDRVSGLILVNSRTSADAPEAARKRIESAEKVEETRSVDAVVDGMLPKLFAAETARSRPELVGEWSARMRKTPAEGVAGALRGMAARPDRSAVIKGAAFPVLILAGEEDQIVPAEEARSIARLSSRCELFILPGVGHMAPVEDPGGASVVLRRFLERIG